VRNRWEFGNYFIDRNRSNEYMIYRSGAGEGGIAGVAGFAQNLTEAKSQAERLIHLETPNQIFEGMAGHVARQDAEAALYKAEELTAILNMTKGDVSAATGELERETPLFRDSGAGGQGNLLP
jgi:hypothetical protein